MIQLEQGDITNQKVDAIVNAANSFGYCGGFIGKWIRLPGVAESIQYATKGKIEKLCGGIKLPGEVYVTESCGLPAPYIIHAVTMMIPGTFSSIKTIEKCLGNILATVNGYQFETIAVPLLGTGNGGLSKEKVRQLMIQYFRERKETYLIVEK